MCSSGFWGGGSNFGCSSQLYIERYVGPTFKFRQWRAIGRNDSSVKWIGDRFNISDHTWHHWQRWARGWTKHCTSGTTQSIDEPQSYPWPCTSSRHQKLLDSCSNRGALTISTWLSTTSSSCESNHGAHWHIDLCSWSLSKLWFVLRAEEATQLAIHTMGTLACSRSRRSGTCGASCPIWYKTWMRAWRDEWAPQLVLSRIRQRALHGWHLNGVLHDQCLIRVRGIGWTRN